MLFLDNDMEYFVEPRMMRTGSSRDDASLYRSRTSLGASMGAESDWEILPEDIMICKDPYGRDWQLGTGGFGSVSSPANSLDCGLPCENNDGTPHVVLPENIMICKDPYGRD